MYALHMSAEDEIKLMKSMSENISKKHNYDHVTSLMQF